jgi:hypothetical protein
MRAEEYANLVLARVPKLRVRLFDSDSFFRNEKICTIQESIPYPKFGKKNRSYFQKESFKRFFKIAVKTLFSGTTIHGFRGGQEGGGGTHPYNLEKSLADPLPPKNPANGLFFRIISFKSWCMFSRKIYVFWSILGL